MSCEFRGSHIEFFAQNIWKIFSKSLHKNCRDSSERHACLILWYLDKERNLFNYFWVTKTLITIVCNRVNHGIKFGSLGLEKSYSATIVALLGRGNGIAVAWHCSGVTLWQWCGTVAVASDISVLINGQCPIHSLNVFDLQKNWWINIV